MKRILPILLLSFVFFSCMEDKGNIRIKGSFRHLQDGIFFVFSTDHAWQGFDTIRVVDGEFDYTHAIEDTMVLTMQYPNFMQLSVIAIPGNTITIKGDANNLLSIRLSGCEDNEKLSEFRHSIVGKSESQVTSLAESFIRDNPHNFASVPVLQNYFINVEHQNKAKIEELLNLMLKSSPERTVLKILQQKLRSYLRCREGQMLPDFKAVTLDSQTVTSDSLRGSYSLITFWSTWDAAHMAPVEYQRQILRPYLKKLKILNIALNADTLEVKRHIRSDSIPGLNVCDRQSWQSPLVRTFGIRYFPSNILVAPNGKIIGRDLIEADLKKALDKNL